MHAHKLLPFLVSTSALALITGCTSGPYSGGSIPIPENVPSRQATHPEEFPGQTQAAEAEKPAPTPMIELPPKSQWTATASGVQEPMYAASNAIDGKADTRWSSPAEDPQWIQVDMGGTGTLCGLTILWETAYSKEYHVDTSLDGHAWNQVYATSQGDGRTDFVTTKPTLCRYFRIVGTKRGTGWGHSIWEIDASGPASRVIASAPAAAGADPANAIDGDVDTMWVAPAGGPVVFELDLQRSRAFGGARIDWGTNYATELNVDLSDNGSTWRNAATVQRGTGKFDLLLFPPTEARYIRLNIKATSSNAPAAIREITIKGPDEKPTASTLYEIAAAKSRPGLYPEQFRQRQVYWTIMGLPVDRQESLLDEYGNFEPYAGSFSVVPFIYVNDQLYSALDAKKLRQELEKGYLPLPRVAWDIGPLQLLVQGQTHGSPQNAASYVRYTLRNTSAEPLRGRLFLAIRPVQINPVWQYGGLSPIQSLELTNKDEGAVIRINNADKLISLTAPDGFGARPFDAGDIVQDLQSGNLPPAQKVDKSGDLVSGALAFDFALMPAQEVSAIIAAPLHGTKDDIISLEQMSLVEKVDPARALQSAFDFRIEELKKRWDDQLGSAVIDVPDRAVVNTIKSQIAYILLNMDGPAIQPGSRNYNRSWMRDGSMTSVSMLRMGVTEPVREFIDWYAQRVTADGLVPPILDNNGNVNGGFGSNLEYDSQGEFIYLVTEYYRLTGDRAFLEKHFGEVVRAMKYMVTLRDKTLAPDYMAGQPARERFVGILPASISHEGYSTPVHSYWDDYWALKGWKDGKAAAEALGSNDVATWAGGQYSAFRDSLKKSIAATITFAGIPFIPGCAEKGDMDATSTSIAISPCGEMDILPRKELENTFDIYYNDLRRRLEPGWDGTFTPYELRSITTFVALGQKDRASQLLDYIMGCRRPPGFNHLAEVVMGDARKGGYIGDMPHTWVGSGLVNAVREMLVQEQNGKLVILAGVPAQWLTTDPGVRVAKLPTEFGQLDMTARATGKKLTVTLGGGFKAPKGVDLRWPFAGRPASVTIDGQAWTSFDDTECRFGSEAREVIAEW